MKTPLTKTQLLQSTFLLCLLLLGAMLLSLLYGPEGTDLLRVFWQKTPDRLEQTILFSVRLPRVVLGAAVGASLGAAGAALQALLRNPLADPYVLGLSGGAALGGTFALLLTSMLIGAGISLGILDQFLVELMAFFGAVCTIFFIWRVARVSGDVSPYTLLLAGTAFNAFTAAIVTFIETIVSAEKAQEILFWLMGTLGGTLKWETVFIALFASMVTTIGLIVYSPSLNLLSLGEEAALQGGVDVRRTQRAVFLLVSFGIGLTVSATGLIGFVGLIVPHILRLLVGPDLRRLILCSALGGAIFLVICDLGTRAAFSILHTEPPVGVITAMAGGPFFLWLLQKRRIYRA